MLPREPTSRAVGLALRHDEAPYERGQEARQRLEGARTRVDADVLDARVELQRRRGGRRRSRCEHDAGARGAPAARVLAQKLLELWQARVPRPAAMST